MSQDEDIDFDDALALCTEDQYSLWSVASYWPWRCQGITKAGVLCQAICRKIKLEEYWPGVTDRCIHHIDEMARRTRDIARTARRTGAADVEALPPYERHHRLKRIRRAEQARLAAVRRSASSPTERTSRRGSCATGRQRGQLTFAFAASLAAQLEEPPRLEPGTRVPVSNAVDIAKGERN